MELNYSKLTCKKLSGTYMVEHPIENDLFIPDDFPEIEEVLQYETSVSVLDKSIQGEKLRVEGIVNFEVCYRGRDGLCHGVKNKLPFSKVIENKCDTKNVRVNSGISYMNYRMIHERRMDVRGAVSLKIECYTNDESSIVSDSMSPTMCTKHEVIKGIAPVGCASRRQTLREDLEIEARDEVCKIATAAVYVDMQESKVMANKVVIKGSVRLDTLAEDRSGKGILLQHFVPFSQVVDVEGAEENDSCCAYVECDDYTVDIEEGISGCYIGFSVSLNSDVQIYRPIEAVGVCDGYSTSNNIKIKKNKVEYLTPTRWLSERFECKKNIKLSTPPQKILFVKGMIDDVQNIQSDDGVICRISYHTSVIYLDNEGVLCCDNDSGEYENTIVSKKEAQFLCEIHVTMIGTSYVIETNGVSVSIGFNQSGCVLQKNIKEMITGIEDGDILNDDRKGMIILSFAKNGDTPWDIGKKYHVSYKKIIAENGLNEETIDAYTPLIIPMDKTGSKMSGEV